MITIRTKFLRKSDPTIYKIKPIGDVHLGSSYCDLRSFKKFLREDDDPYTFFFGIGDLFDAVVQTDWRYIPSAIAHGKRDDFIDAAVRDMCYLLEPYKDRIICLGLGNHEKTILKKANTNMVKRVCRELDVPYAGYSFFIDLSLIKVAKDGKRITKSHRVVIRAHHGWGSGSRTQGYPLTKYAHDIKNYEADVYCYGHDHRLMSDHMDVIVPCGDSIDARKKFICLTGTFLRTLSKTTDAAYGEEAGYPPAPVGGLTIKIKPERVGVKIDVE